MEVMILKNDTRLGIKRGEVYHASTYPHDREKVSLNARFPDGHDPCCNQYRTEVATKINGKWCKVIDNTYVMMSKKEIEGIMGVK